MGFYVAQFLTGAASASSLFLVAAGLSIIFGVTRIVNFAHGSLYMLGAFIAYSISARIGFWPAVPLAMLTVGCVGWVIERTVLRRLYGAPELYQLVATFGLVLIIQDIALAIWGPTDLLGPRAPGLGGAVRILGEPVPTYDLFLIFTGLAVLAGVWWMFTKTRFGVLVRAATEDREMLQALGVKPARLFQLSFFIGAALAGLGGALEMPRQPASLLMDLRIIAEVFVVVVIGGLGSVAGAYLAAMMIAQLNAFGILILPEITLVVAFAAMAVVLMVRPHGFFGKPMPTAADGVEIQPPAGLGWWTRPLTVALCAGLILLPLFGSTFTIVLVTDIAIFALFAAGLHFMMGTGGLISFGHAAFFGLGAYAVALLTRSFDVSMIPALIAAPLAAAAGAAIIGWFAVRLSGVYMAMLTLAGAQILWSVSVQWQDVTGGDDGIIGIWPAPWLADTIPFYFAVIVLVGLTLLTLSAITRGRFGMLLRASRDSADRAAALGINVRGRRWIAITIAGASAGIAGGLFTFAKGSVFPDALAIPHSVDALVMVLLGGVHSPAAPIIGAATFGLLEDFLSRLPYWRAVLGASIIAIAVFAPGGIGAALARATLPRNRERA